MSDYTAGEIAEAIEADQVVNDGYDEFEGGWHSLDYHGNGYEFEVTLRGERVKCMLADAKMPCEGGGEDVYMIIQAGTQYFKKEGYYASHYGTDWDGACRQVNKVTRMTDFYE